jgi:hypothetical protein
MDKKADKKVDKKVENNKAIGFGEDDYVRPSRTYTENLSKEQIKELLDFYVQIDDMSKVAIDTHIRYFEEKNGEMKFRLGGYLMYNADEYIRLTNRINKWSVQKHDTTIFYRKMTTVEIKDEIKSEQKEEIDKKDDLITKYKTQVKELIYEVKRLQKEYEKLEKESKAKNKKPLKN